MKEYFGEGRFAIVGSAGGLGKDLVSRMAGMGAELLMFDVDNNNGTLADALRKQGQQARYWHIDVRDSDGLEAVLQSAVGSEGLDGLVYLVRGRERVPYSQLSAQAWDNDYVLTVRGAFFCTRAVVPNLKAARSGQPSVLFVSSILSELVGMEGVSYHISKAALDQLTRYLSVKLGPSGIRVNAVQPGFIVQDIHVERFRREDNAAYRKQAEAAHPLGRVGYTADIIDPMLFLLSPMSRFVTGQILRVDGGLTVQEQSNIVLSTYHAAAAAHAPRDNSE